MVLRAHQEPIWACWRWHRRRWARSCKISDPYPRWEHLASPCALALILALAPVPAPAHRRLRLPLPLPLPLPLRLRLGLRLRRRPRLHLRLRLRLRLRFLCTAVFLNKFLARPAAQAWSDAPQPPGMAAARLKAGDSACPKSLSLGSQAVRWQVHAADCERWDVHCVRVQIEANDRNWEHPLEF